MSTTTTKTLKTPGFSYRGFDIPALRINSTLIDDLETNKQAYELALKSSPLAWRVGLYIVGRDLSLGIEEADSLPTPVKEAGKLVYEDAQAKKGRGGWHKDGAYMLPRSDAPKGMLQPKDEGFVLARYFKDIDGFVQDDGWKIKLSPSTEESLVWLPHGDGFFVVPTMDGAYNPITGTPRETVSDRKEAVKRWVSAGLTEEQADKEISRFYRMDRGTAAVGSWSDDLNGPLCVGLYREPRYRHTSVGSFPASRRAERSEAPKNSGFRLVTDAEYKAFMADRETLEAAKKLFGK